jgi:conjugative transfer signal peptidase TraF
MRGRALFCLALVAPLLALVLAVLAGLRLNTTRSFPTGFYWAVPKTPATGDLILFRLPQGTPFDLAWDQGYIGPGGLAPYECMLKRIAAVGGDTVYIDDAGVRVNGQNIPNTAPLPVDLSGRKLPVCRLQGYRLKAGEVLPISDYSPISFDGRYFGTIPRACIQSVVRPVWTWQIDVGRLLINGHRADPNGFMAVMAVCLAALVVLPLIVAGAAAVLIVAASASFALIPVVVAVITAVLIVAPVVAVPPVIAVIVGLCGGGLPAQGGS